MYKIVSLFSFLFRQFILPNPFINIVSENYAELFNYIFGGVFIVLAYTITGTWYTSRKEDRWKGSVGFFFNYTILTLATIAVSSLIHDVYWIAGIVFIIFIILCIIESNLLGRRISL